MNWAYRRVSEPLAHRHYDTFELAEARGGLLPDRLPVSFSTDREGNITSLAAPFDISDLVYLTEKGLAEINYIYRVEFLIES